MQNGDVRRKPGMAGLHVNCSVSQSALPVGSTQICWQYFGENTAQAAALRNSFLLVLGVSSEMAEH